LIGSIVWFQWLPLVPLVSLVPCPVARRRVGGLVCGIYYHSNYDGPFALMLNVAPIIIGI